VYFASPPPDQEEEQHNHQRAISPGRRGKGSTQVVALLYLLHFSYKPEIFAAVSLQGSQEANN